jgi:glycine cleavage system transcriptional repressor
VKNYFVLSAVGSNRPGIVADVSEVIYRCGCNLEDSRMTLLGTQFVLMILLTGESAAVSDDLQEGCRRLETEKGLKVFLVPLETRGHEPPPEAPEAGYELIVVGMDRAGIVYRATKLLASKAIDITDLETLVDPAPESGSPIFTMRAAVALPEEVDVGELRKDLDALADELQVEISLGKARNPRSGDSEGGGRRIPTRTRKR